MISLLIKSNPYESGNPLVESTDIVVSKNSMSADKVVDSIKFVRFSNFTYRSIFCKISDGPL